MLNFVGTGAGNLWGKDAGAVFLILYNLKPIKG